MHRKLDQKQLGDMPITEDVKQNLKTLKVTIIKGPIQTTFYKEKQTLINKNAACQEKN